MKISANIVYKVARNTFEKYVYFSAVHIFTCHLHEWVMKTDVQN